MRKLRNSELNRPDTESYKQLEKLPCIVVLDNVRSQHNIGSVFRTADAFRIEAIYLCGITATPPHREIHKTALGATESVEWKYFDDTLVALKALKADGYKIYGIEQTTDSIPLKELVIAQNEKIALVFGHEVHGISQGVVDACHECIEIKQYGTKHSLNVSVCAGIVIWEVFGRYDNIS
jgi:tRNA G18 (ribose-2'-O)-methylase SpoU